jgi:thiamine-phosphate diphosphorylase
MPERGAIPRLHLIATSEVVGRPGFARRAAELLSLGGSRLALHLRAPEWTGRALFDLAAPLGVVARGSGSLLVVNDRVDVALASRAGGVQLGHGAMPVDAVRRFASALRIGASVHAADEASRAAAAGADFLLAGTLWPTPSHPGAPGSGTEWLTEIVGPGVPVVGIGGVTPERAVLLRGLGLHGAAVVRAVWDDPDPPRALVRMLDALVGADEGGVPEPMER